MTSPAAIIELIHNLFRDLDTAGHAAEASAAFADDGLWERQGAILTGPSEIEKVLADRDPSRRSCHVITNMQIHGDETQGWTARYYLSAYLAAGDEPFKLAGLLDCSDQIALRRGQPRIVRKTSRQIGAVK